jgi:hypothetical protein
VYFPLRYHRSNRGLEDKHWYAQLTRFLPEDIRTLFDLRTTYTDLDEDERALVATAGTTERVDAFLAGLWAE